MRTRQGNPRNNRIAIFILIALILTSCVRLNIDFGNDEIERGDTQNESRTVEWNGDGTADIKIEMGVGELNIEGGSSQLVDGNFEWNIIGWKPEIVKDGNSVTIKQPDNHSISFDFNMFKSNSFENTWDIQLNEIAPINLIVDLGAGDTTIDLTAVNLQKLDLNGGAGVLDIDLSGDYQDELDVRIDAGVGEVIVDLDGNFAEDATIKIDSGVGETTVYIPRNTGVRVNVDKGIGEVDVRGLIANGNGEYINAAYSESNTTIDLDIDAGVGAVNLKVRE